MDFKKIYKRGLGISILLLIFIIGVLFVPNLNEKRLFNEKPPLVNAPEDYYEQNDFYWEAYNISSNRGMWLSSINGTGTQADNDFYEIVMNPGFEILKVNLTFSHISGNIDILVCDNSGVPLTGSASTTDNEYIDYIVPYSGIFYLQVSGDNASNSYDLWWGTDDGYEPNNDLTSAYDLTTHENIWLSSIFGSGFQFDEDWYKIYINPGYEFLHVSLLFSHIMGDIDIALYNSSNFLLDSSTGTIDNEFIDFVVPSPGEYYLHIYHANNGNPYDLWWNTTMPSVTEDAYEENDFDGQAYDLTGYSAMWLTSVFGPGYQWDEDWYLVYLDPGEERIHVELSFSHMAGDINIEVYYYDGGNFTYLAGSYSTSDSEYIDVIAPWSGFYYIRVYGPNAGNEYDMYWEDLMSSGDDWMEENDDYWSSWYVDPNYYSSLKLMYNDDDWFHIYLRNGDDIDVSIYFNHLEGDLELELWDPSESLRVGSYSGDDNEFVTYTADISGDWRIKVYHAYGDSELYYDLDIWVNAGEDPKDDWMEENDGFWSSWYVDPNYYHDLILNNNDEDWFHTYVDEGEIIDVSIYFQHAKGNLELELWSPLDTLRSGSYTEDNYEYISFMADISGNWRFRVYHADADSKVNYNLGIWKKDDFYEWNNHPQDIDKDHPAILAQYEQTWLSEHYGVAVQGDHDWYVIDVTPGFEHLVIELLFNHSLGNIDIEIYDHGGSFLVGNYSMTDNEYIDYILPYSGIFAIHIYGNDMKNKYNMWWDDLRTDFRADDNYEMNNDALSAYDISFAENKSLWEIDGLALQYDQDWYEIYIEGTGLELLVWLAYDSAEGLMGFEVYDHDLNKITGNFTLTDNDYIACDVSNGTYYIRVFGDNTGNVYNLWWGIQVPENIGMIPGYDLLILIASIIGISMVVIKITRSKFEHK